MNTNVLSHAIALLGIQHITMKGLAQLENKFINARVHSIWWYGHTSANTVLDIWT
jgi:hypothetical protein